MGLPPYSGPFTVGVLDLEIPVRQPRSFGADTVPNERINKPKSSRPKKRSNGSDKAAQTTCKDSQWDPLTGGAKTCTLHLSTVLFTLYYPSAVEGEAADSYDRAAWLGRPKRRGLSALFRYVGNYGPMAVPASPAIFLLAAAKMRAICAPPLADPDDPRTRAPPPFARDATGLFGDLPPRFPVLLFSHGLAGNRLAYSQFCGELASHGIVVAALDHRDGSGLASAVRVPMREPKADSSEESRGEAGSSRTAEQAASQRSKGEASMGPQEACAQPQAFEQKHHGAQAQQLHENSGRPQLTKGDVPYLTFERLGMRSFAPDPRPEEVAMRQAQLAMRGAEIDECLHVLRRIAGGEGEQVARESTRGLANKLSSGAAKRERRRRRGDAPRGPEASLEGAPERLAEWRDKLDVDKPALVGHSFGGATVLEKARQSSQEAEQPWLLIMALDPWVEPLVEDDRPPNVTPTYVLNTEAFSVWQESFTKLKRVLHQAREANGEHRGWLMTVCATNHLDVSDYPFLLPHVFRSTVGPEAAVRLFSRACLVQTGLSRQRFRERAGAPGAKFEEGEGDPLMGGGVKRAREVGTQAMASLTDVGSRPAEADAKGASEDWERSRVRAQRQEASSSSDAPSSDACTPQARPAHDDSSSTPRLGSAAAPDTSTPQSHTSTTGSGKAKKHHELLERLMHGHGDEEQKRKVRGVIAKRSNSGNNLLGVPRTSADLVDWSSDASQVQDADRDADEVHRTLEDISRRLAYKRPKIHSLLALLFRLKGVRPGLDTPGSVLVHSLS